MNRRNARILMAAAVLGGLGVAAAPTPSVQAHGHCRPPSVPTVPPQQAQSTLMISGNYNVIHGVGPLDGLGCVAGNDVADTRVLPPRTDFVRLHLPATCTPGTKLPPAGSQLRGLGLNLINNVDMTCTAPNIWGHTAYLSPIYNVRQNLAGTITAVVYLNGRKLTTQARTVLPVNQPA